MKNHRPIWLSGVLALLLCLSSIAVATGLQAAQETPREHGHDAVHVQHVLLLSIDGLHAVDLMRYVRLHPRTALAGLTRMGVLYPNASTSQPSDSFPGLLAMVTGGSPRSTGVWYDASYDRSLSPPGSHCATRGTEVLYDESIDKNSTVVDGGGAINPAQLPLDPTRGCVPVYPHSYLRVNTLFEVVKAAGRRTAWCDKHLAYDIVNGPSGHGVDDLFTPEIAADDTTGSVVKTEGNDDLKVHAILHEIAGLDHTGTHHMGVPALFGMNFQAVSVAQKLPIGGYTDGLGTPSPALLGALTHTDQAIGAMVRALRAHGLLASTVIIVTAKHGQTPIDRTMRQIIDDGTIPALVKRVQKNLLALATQDDLALLWLRDQRQTAAVVAQLAAHRAQAGVQEILAGDALQARFDDPRTDPRTPDIIVLPRLGIIYAGAGSTKIAEHGGFSDQDTNAPILVANVGLERRAIPVPVQTTQIAPTILQLLGLNPQELQAVRMEHTQVLAGL